MGLGDLVFSHKDEVFIDLGEGSQSTKDGSVELLASAKIIGDQSEDTDNGDFIDDSDDLVIIVSESLILKISGGLEGVVLTISQDGDFLTILVGDVVVIGTSV